MFGYDIYRYVDTHACIYVIYAYVYIDGAEAKLFHMLDTEKTGCLDKTDFMRHIFPDERLAFSLELNRQND